MTILGKWYTDRAAAVLALASVLASADAAQARQANGNGNGNAGALSARIDEVLAGDPARNAQWGIAVMDVSTGEMLYTRQAERQMTPASGLKLIVAATAAHVLGPSFRYTTTLLADGPIEGGVLRGDLVIRGTGDPTISGRYADSTVAIFSAFADSLEQRGISSIEGGVVVDESEWDEVYIHEDWEQDDLVMWYGAPVAPLGFNNNVLDVTIAPGQVGGPATVTWVPETDFMTVRNETRTVAAGQPETLDFDRGGPHTLVISGDVPADADARTEYLAVDDAAGFAGTVLREVLEREGIAVGVDEVRVVQQPPANETVLARHQSMPLDSMVKVILMRSQNWFAEQLVKTLGAQERDDGSWDAGLAVEREFLITDVGLSENEFTLRDASGLSPNNAISAAALAKLMRYIESTPDQAMVRNALPTPGSGAPSLNDRLTDLGDRVHAKTGSIEDVASLSGMVTTDSGREVAFSIIANGTGAPTETTAETIDNVVRAIAATN